MHTRLGRLGIHPLGKSEAQINEILDSLINDHFIGKPRNKLDDKQSTPINQLSRHRSLLIKAKAYLRKYGFLATMRLCIKLFQARMIRLLAANKGSKSDKSFHKKMEQGPWFRIQNPAQSKVSLIENFSGNCKNTDEIVLIATVLNEQSNIVSWLNSLVNQSVKAGQIVIVDGGSTDGTQELILDFAKDSPIEIQLISFSGASHAKGRNIALDAIRESFEIAIFVDAGCYYRSDYVSRFCAAFNNQHEATIVGMTWIAKSSSEKLDRKITPDWGGFSPEQWATFLPSARAFALNRKALNFNLRFPEWLTRTGEDTAFMIEAKRFIQNWLVITTPEVEWHSPDDVSRLAELEFKYAIGDGESGVRDSAFFNLAC
jgi:hypothetical protein